MVTLVKIENVVGTNKYVAELRGLSTDDKPTDYANGSTFFEMNTGKAFMFNETATSWVEI